MSKDKVNAYYDSDEGIAWGPYTFKEMKDDLERPRPKPKHRRTVSKIASKEPSASSSNDTMFTATSVLEKAEAKTEGSSVTTYHSANGTFTVASKGNHTDSAITISSDEEDDCKENDFKAYGNLNTAIQIKKENIGRHPEVIIILDDTTTSEKLTNDMPDKLEKEMKELALSEKSIGSDEIHLDLSTDSSSIFDASYFDGKEPWKAVMDTTSDEIHLDLSTDSSSIFDASYFDGKEPLKVEMDTSDEHEPNEPVHDHLQPLAVQPTKLTPAKSGTQIAKVAACKTPQVFKVPGVVSARKTKGPSKFKDIISPVRLYIQHSPVAPLRQNFAQRPVASPVISPKTSPSVNKPKASDNCKMVPQVLYKPPAKHIVTTKSKQWFMPPSLGKHVINPLVIKHEKKLNVKDVSRLSEKLRLEESSLDSEAETSANMSVLCVKKNF
nr:unnamed protein product [Callosobruchus analis]